MELTTHIYQHGSGDLVRAALTCFKVRILLVETAFFHGNEDVEKAGDKRLFQTLQKLSAKI